MFDGHGGAKVSKYIKQTLYSNFLLLMPEKKSKWNDKTVYSGLKNAVKKVDNEILKIKNWNHQGSTLSAVYINKNKLKNTGKYFNEIKNKHTLVTDKNDKSDKNVENEDNDENSDENDINCNYSILTVNVGDSRIVLSRGKRAIELTTDHKPNMR